MKTSLTVSEIGQRIDNDESLYLWHRQSRLSKREFIKQNRAELGACILAVLNRKPA